jgi:hypothetical protein
MDFDCFEASFLGHKPVAEVDVFDQVVEAGRAWSLLRARTPGRRRLVITAGFHGNEVAGPLTLLEHFSVIVGEARRHDVGLTIYPCLNPSGFDARTRYNQSGTSPNNDLLRYEVAPNVWVGELGPGQRYLRHRVHSGGPNETRALARALEVDEAPHAALDLHQDPWLRGTWCYAYTFGDRGAYRPLLAQSRRHLPIAEVTEVDDDLYSDDDGIIEFHDGSVTDYFHRRGVPYTAALETTTDSPLTDCDQVNLIWIRGFIGLAAQNQ